MRRSSGRDAAPAGTGASLAECRTAGRVAYDLRYACDHFPGIGTHAHLLLQALLAQPGDERYLVIWNPKLHNTRFALEPLRTHPRVTWVERRDPPLGVGGLFSMGRWLRDSPTDVYLSPFHLVPFGARRPCVVTVHDVRPLRRGAGLGWWQRQLFRLSLIGTRRARTVIAISDFSRLEMERVLPLPDGQIRTVRHGIRGRPRLERECRPPGMPEGDFAFVVGDNRPHKNLGLLAEAWARVEPRVSLRLVAAGPRDPRYADLASLAARAGARRVTTLGWVGAPELEWLYRRARMLLLPSLYEGFGAPMVEAFAHGVPVLAADIPALREIGGQVPRFVDPAAPDAWADEIAALAADSERQECMRRAGLEGAGMPTYDDTARATLDIVRAAARPA